MLRQVLALLETREGGMGAAEISRQLRVPPAALEGMLETLVQHGRLARQCADDTPCGACPLQPECNLLAGRENVRYVVVPRCTTYPPTPLPFGKRGDFMRGST
jgi:hypothetical protein